MRRDGFYSGPAQTRFARVISAPLHTKKGPPIGGPKNFGASKGARTLDLNLGKVAL